MDELTREEQDKLFNYREGWQPCFEQFTIQEQLGIKSTLADFDALGDDPDYVPDQYSMSGADKRRCAFNTMMQAHQLKVKREKALMSLAPVSAVTSMGHVCSTVLTMLETGQASLRSAQFTYLSLPEIVNAFHSAAGAAAGTEYAETVASLTPPIWLIQQIGQYLENAISENPATFAQEDIDLLAGNLRLYLDELYTNMTSASLPSSFREVPELSVSYRDAVKHANEVMNIAFTKD